MSSDRFARVQEILLRSIDLPEEERVAYLSRECRGDPELRAEVESLLAHEGTPTEMLGGEAGQSGETQQAIRSSGILDRSFSHYRILSKIGSGGMGEVYLAQDERLEREVALKILRAGILADDAARKRFRKEALALSKLNHPNIATIYDFDTQEGMDFLVMEHVAGETLNEKLSAGPMPEREIARLGLQMAEGLVAAHGQGIIHRDLKPGNVRLTSDGRLKLLDFGLAKLVRQPGDASTTETLTEAHGLVGTLPYMAPEQLRGETVDARTDIWAAGVVLYEMATGRKAFPEADSARLITAILSGPPSMPSAVHRRVSPALESIIVKCLEKDPERRYQSAKELAVDLRRLETPSIVGVVRPAPQEGRQRWIVTGVASSVVALVALGFALNVGGLRERLFSSVPRIRSLAVLPLKNLSGDSTQEYFSDGMTDAVINDLCKVAALRVISTTSVMQYKETHKSLTAIARELGVDAVVEGSVLRSGGRVRINAELIQPGKERQLWAASYEREMKDVLTLQNEVAGTIAGAVRTRLTPEDRTRLASARTVNPEAYEEYLLGQHPETTTAGAQNWERVKAHYLRAIEIDPEFALAYAALGNTYADMTLYSKLPPFEAAPLGLEAATKAVQLDGDLAEAYASLANVKLQLMWDWPGAEAALKRALELNPNSTGVRTIYRFFLTCMGRHEEAVAVSVSLLQDQPNSDRFMFAWDLFYARRYDEAITELKKCLQSDPKAGSMRAWLAYSYAVKGMRAQALAECDTLEAHPDWKDPFWECMLGEVYAVSGVRGKALDVLERMRAQEKHGYVDPAEYAYVYAALGDKDQAFAALGKAIDVRSANVLQMDIEPVFDGLRSDPRFGELLHRMNLPMRKP